MNEQPTGPKPKWWSRPQTDRPRATEPPADAYDLAPPAGATEPVHSVRERPGAPEGSTDAPSVSASDTPASEAESIPGGPAPEPPSPGSPPSTPEPPSPAPPLSAPGPGAPRPASATGPAEPVDAPASPAPPATRPIPAESAGSAAPPAPRQPLHAPDPYGTPPYGGPGPWAPAPPVQRPVPTPPGGTALPQQPPYAAGQAPAPEPSYAAGQAPASEAPYAAPPAPPAPPASQWLQYDPWSAPGEPFTKAGDPVPRKRRRGALLAGAVLLALVAGCVGGGVGAYVERNGGITSVRLPQSGKEPQGRAPDSVAGIAASALPSVVTIHVTGAAESGTGTGFVLDNAGHILTNNHVVKAAGDSGKISVTFSGGESVAAQVVGRDTGYDLAVVKVSGVSGLKPLALGNSDNVLVGDPVVAIGAPFDLSNTVTSGIISAKERPITAGGEDGDGSDVSYVDALQTDAPINPGNSGGPLVDSKARVIGINSAIRSAGSGGSEGSGGQAGSIGLGFAIPINQAKRVAEELINTGRATHPVIGVTLDMKFTGDGARVADKAVDGKPSVTADGPGAKAGIRPQDVITKVDGQRVHGAEELIVKIRAHRPGDRLRLALTRDGKEQELTLTLGSAS
ncbi:trypsin-like peptidase domain-containing protein [Streptomyces sp. MBT27]|uniref:trypsin-like peptidase domain-containing protein n=1 Tax=Streptomyces sp. MBT27 TaxID=1488356 RepID=UPI001968F3F6|nr:trypsin-like peptidase domain-containing protein [Streptomyces sp. MBT27]